MSSQTSLDGEAAGDDRDGPASYLYERSAIGMASFRVLGSVERDLDDDTLERTKHRVSDALTHFPELTDRTVTVGKKREADTWYAEADWTNDLILLPTHEECPYLTIAHELSHLAIHRLDQQGVDVPLSSEEFCSIFTVARVPPDRIDRREISYLGAPSIRRDRWPAVCRRALDYRENNHDYIKQCERWLGIRDDPDADQDADSQGDAGAEPAP